MGDIIENLDLDRDTIPLEEVEQQFGKKYNLLTETAVSLKTSYINNLSVNESLKIAISIQDQSIEVYELNNTSLRKLCHFHGHEKPVTEVVIHPKNENVIFSSGLDGVIRLWDIRSGVNFVQEYREEKPLPVRPYECMDVSDTGNVFCSGSQLVQEDSYIVFWDPRTTQPLGAYWESHTEDITQVKFIPNSNKILASGATDGLINIFNLCELDEDSALLFSMNVGNSVETLRWLREDQLSCVTQCNDLQLWNPQTGDLIKEYTRDKIARSIKRSREDECYVVDTYRASGEVCVLAGSHGGDGNTLRSVSVSEKRLQPSTHFAHNKQVVRCAHYDDTRELLITCGESGLISAWSAAARAHAPRTAPARAAHRHAPY